MSHLGTIIPSLELTKGLVRLAGSTGFGNKGALAHLIS